MTIYPVPKPSGGKRAPKGLKNRVRTMRRLKCVHCGGVQTVGDRLCETCGGTGERIVDVWRKRPLKQRKRIKAVNRKRGGHAFPKNVDAAYREWIRGRQCLIAGRAPRWVSLHHRCEGRVQVAHVRSRGAGGPDHANVLPLCAGHHAEQHAIGKLSFEARYGLSLREEAEVLWKLYGESGLRAGTDPQ